jgi:Zn-dependent protease with chaperone function
LWNPPANADCESCGTTLVVAPPATQSSLPIAQAAEAAPAATSVAAAGAAVLAGGLLMPAPVPLVEAPPAERSDRPAPSSMLERPPIDERLYAPVLGPVDRESFFAAQRRHRRQTWRLTALCGFAAIVTGIPLSLVLTPMVFAVILILTRLLHVAFPVPDAVWDAYERVGRVLPDAIEAMDDPATPGVSEGDVGRIPLGTLIATVLIWLLPGILLMLAIWPALIHLFRHGGGGGVLLSLGAREPDLSDLEERQLVNIIEEMAIAAGLPAPRVMLLDTPVANAAAVGSSPQDASIVVSRALLDDLDRDETQGVLAHLVASIGNGDLRGAMSIQAIFQTFGVAGALVKAPISGPARATVRRVLGYVFSRHKPHERAAEAHVIAGMLTQGIWESEEDDFAWVNEPTGEPRQRPGPKLRLLLYFPILFIVVFAGTLLLSWSAGARQLALFGVFALAALLIWYQREYAAWAVVHGAKWTRAMVMLPYYLAAMMPQFVIMLLTSFVLEPLIALLWRTRRYLADATAVQLTRQPDGLARGLVGLVGRGGVIPGGKWAGPLFVVGPEAAGARAMRAFQQRQRQKMEEARRQIDPEGDDTGARGLVADARAFVEMQRALAREQQRQDAATGKPPQPAFLAAAAAASAAQAEQGAGFTGSGSGNVMPFHPPLKKRLAKLRRMGAAVAEVDLSPQAQARAAGTPLAGNALRIGVGIIVILLWLLIVVLMCVAIALMMMLSLAFTGFLMLLVYVLFMLIAPG